MVNDLWCKDLTPSIIEYHDRRPILLGVRGISLSILFDIRMGRVIVLDTTHIITPINLQKDLTNITLYQNITVHEYRHT